MELGSEDFNLYFRIFLRRKKFKFWPKKWIFVLKLDYHLPQYLERRWKESNSESISCGKERQKIEDYHLNCRIFQHIIVEKFKNFKTKPFFKPDVYLLPTFSSLLRSEKLNFEKDCWEGVVKARNDLNLRILLQQENANFNQVIFCSSNFVRMLKISTKIIVEN